MEFSFNTAGVIQSANLLSYNELCNNSIGIYLLKVNNRNARTRCKICSKLIIKTPEQYQNVVIFDIEHISNLTLVFPLLTLNSKYRLEISFTESTLRLLVQFSNVSFLVAVLDILRYVLRLCLKRQLQNLLTYQHVILIVETFIVS